MSIFDQAKFQGHLNKKNYFEGWYYKCLTHDRKFSLALIPGISLNTDDPHAFIQFFITNHEDHSIATHYVRYDISDFSSHKILFYISIKDNVFSKDFISLNIHQDGLILKGDLDIYDHQDIPTNLYQPTIMGPFAYMPFMECNHGVISMDSKARGHLTYQGQSLNFDQTHLYIEKDYGKSFPSKYIWIQSNHFKHPSDSLMFSYAIIPFLKLKFNGLIASLYVNHRHYRFSTYNFSKVKVNRINDHLTSIEITKRSYRLIIKAYQEAIVQLKSPHKGKMDHEIKEGLSGYVEVELYHHKKLIFDDTGYYAGIELMFN